MTDQDPLDFEHADYASDAPGTLTCELCGKPVDDYYYHVAGKLACKHCQPQVAAELAKNPRFGRALLFGLGAAALGSAIWYGIIAATGYELGLIAIVVGLMVGGAVRKGSGGVGGLSTQLLAVFLTYSSIVFAYTPLIFREFKSMTNPATEESGFTVGAVSGSGFDASSDLAAIEASIAQAQEFLMQFESALTAWTDSADRATRDGALERTYVAVQALLTTDSAPTFVFGDSIVHYAGAPLNALGPWAWSPQLAEAGYPLVAFDPSVTRLDLVSLLDGVASGVAAKTSPNAMEATLGIAVLIAFLYLAPFLAGIENIVGILIIGFALWEAWRLNKRPNIEITGPFEVRRAAPEST
ncbi:MAG: hypothetical protein OEW56_05060 [Gemmatimonadota bacterium]|nr:hypothetical protein [Gemmatimonadota bacterium]